MIVYNSEVATLFRHEISLINRTGIGSNGCKEICLNLNEHRVLKRIKTIINKFRNCIFLQKSGGAMAPGPPVVGGPVPESLVPDFALVNGNT